MSGTIETINNNIKTKVNLIKKIISMIKFHDLSYNILSEIQINNIYNEYNLSYINLLIDYFQFYDEYKKINYKYNNSKYIIDKYNKKKDDYLKEYIIHINKDNIIYKIDSIYKQIEKDIFYQI